MSGDPTEIPINRGEAQQAFQLTHTLTEEQRATIIQGAKDGIKKVGLGGDVETAVGGIVVGALNKLLSGVKLAEIAGGL